MILKWYGIEIFPVVRKHCRQRSLKTKHQVWPLLAKMYFSYDFAIKNHFKVVWENILYIYLKILTFTKLAYEYKVKVLKYTLDNEHFLQETRGEVRSLIKGR